MRRGAAQIALIGVLLLAAALRWWQPGLVEFKYDEAHTVGLALDVARGGPFPLTSGGTSVGIERPALDAYVLAIPLVLGRIESAVLWTGALGVLAVALTYGLGRRVGGRAVGLLAALYMAANPWLVLYDRKLWSHIQVVLSVGLLWLAWESVVHGRRRASFWFFIGAAAQCLCHTLALLQALSWLPALAVAPRRWANRAGLAGAGVGALLLTPYAVGLLTQLSMGQDNASSPASRPPAAFLFDLAPDRGLIQAFSLFGGRNVSVLAGSPVERLGVAATWMAWLVVALIVAGMILTLRSTRSRNADGATAQLVLAWTVIPLVLLSLAAEVHQQYWTVLLPLPALYYGIGACKVIHRLPLSGRHVAGGVALAALLAIWVGSFVEVIAAVEQGKGGAVFGIPLQRWEEATQKALALSEQEDAAGIRVAVKGIDPRYEDEPAILAAVLHAREDVRLVVPGWPYFALIDPRYEGDGNVIATEALRQQGQPLRGVTPGYSLLDLTQSTVFLWAMEETGIEEVMARVGHLAWEGRLTEGRPPARVYILPSRLEVAHRSANTAELFAGGVANDSARIALNEPDCPLTDTLNIVPTVLLPPQANDVPAALSTAKTLVQEGVRRVVFVEQSSGWWDASSAAATALDTTYRQVIELPDRLWTVRVYTLPPITLTDLGVSFAGGPELRAFALDADGLQPGGLLVAHLAWSANIPLPPDLKISLQVLSPSGVVAAQEDRDLKDASLAGGVASYAVSLPPDIAPGEYRVIAVVYDAQSGARLATPAGDVVEIGTVAILPHTLP